MSNLSDEELTARNFFWSTDCNCDGLTEDERRPGAVISVCGAARCRKIAEHHALYFDRVQEIKPWWRFW